MRVFYTLTFFVLFLFALAACPQTETEDTGGSQVGGGQTGAPAESTAYKSSKLATLGKAKLGMNFDEIKALYPEDSGYKFEEPMPDAENPLMVAATPVSEEFKLHEGYGMLNGEVVYIYQAGKLTDEEYDARIAEFTTAYGTPSNEVPDFLAATKFYAGDPEEPEAAETPETPEEGAEATPPEEEAPKDEGIKDELPENAVFWADAKAKLVVIAASEEGEASFMLLRTDKIDEQFEEFNRIMQEMYNKMFEDMSKGMDGATPPADGEAPPAGTGG